MAPAKKNREDNSEKTAGRSVVAKSGMDRRLANLKPFKKGQSGNPKGRRKGQRDYRTLYWIGLEHIANHQGEMTAEEVEEALQVAGIAKALKGDFFFWKEIQERVHGKVTDKMDLTSGGKSIADLITIANAKPQRGAAAPAKV